MWLLKALSGSYHALASAPSWRSVAGGGKHSCSRDLLRLLCGKAAVPYRMSSVGKQVASGNRVTTAATTSAVSLTSNKRLLRDSSVSVIGVTEVVIAVSYLFNFSIV